MLKTLNCSGAPGSMIQYTYDDFHLRHQDLPLWAPGLDKYDTPQHMSTQYFLLTPQPSHDTGLHT